MPHRNRPVRDRWYNVACPVLACPIAIQWKYCLYPALSTQKSLRVPYCLAWFGWSWLRIYLLPLPKTFALCRVLSCVSLSTLPGLMHRLYNRGFALAVSIPKPVPLVIVYLCGLIAGGGLQVLILPNTMGNYTSIVLHRRHLLSWIRFWWIVTIHLRRKAHSLIKVVWCSSGCAVQRPADIGLASAANFSHLHPRVVWAFPPCQKDLYCVNSKCHCAAQDGSAWIVAFSLIYSTSDYVCRIP